MNTADWTWPNPPFEIALVQPEIPPNTGNIARLSAATGTVLHLVGPLGFRITDREVKRAGLDYWPSVNLREHTDLETFLETQDPSSLLLFSTKGKTCYTEAPYRPGSCLVFGRETAGLPESLLETHADRVFTIPIMRNAVRSLNLSSSAAIVLYEALRQVQPR